MALTRRAMLGFPEGMLDEGLRRRLEALNRGALPTEAGEVRVATETASANGGSPTSLK